MGGKADYMGTGLSGLEIGGWESEWVVYMRLPVWGSPFQSASAFSDKSESESVEEDIEGLRAKERV